MACGASGLIVRSMMDALNCGVWMRPRPTYARLIKMRMTRYAGPAQQAGPEGGHEPDPEMHLDAGPEMEDSATAAVFDLLAAHIARLDDRQLIANANDW